MEAEKLLGGQIPDQAAKNGDINAANATDHTEENGRSPREMSTSFSNKSVEPDDVELEDHQTKASEAGEEGNDGTVRMSYEEAMAKYGTGRYQLVIFILLSLVTFSCVFNNNGYIFIGASQKHTCKVPAISNYTDNNITGRVTYVADECTYDKYVEYGNNSKELLEGGIECNSWDYDQSEFTLTMTSEWDINSCNDNKWKIAVASSLYMIGFFLGCIILADLSDRYGRSKLLLISNVCMVVVGVAASFSVNFEMLAIMRLVLGIFNAGARNAGFVYDNPRLVVVCEIVQNRAGAGMIHGSVYSVGGLVVTAISQLLPNWRHFQLACALAYILYIPYYWVMPESPRWMLSMGRTKEANDYFKKSAKINKIKDFPDNLSVYLDHQQKKEGNVLSLFRTPNTRKKSVIICVLWFSVSIVFFGMNYNVGNLAGNIFTNNYLLQLTGIFEFIGMWYLMLGRRPAISSAFFIACFMSGIIPFFAMYGIDAAIVAMGMIGKFFIETNFEMLYVMTAEMYPTSARVTALGMGSSMARLGGAVSPYLVLSNDVWPNLPYVLFAIIAFIAGFTALFLPETKGKKLPDSLIQLEQEQGLSSLNCCCNGSEGSEVSEEEENSIEEVKINHQMA